MGEYADIKKNKMKRFLKWLSNNRDIDIAKGGNHNQNIKYAYGERPYPVPVKHNVIDKNIVKALKKQLVKEWKVCTEEEFDKRLK